MQLTLLQIESLKWVMRANNAGAKAIEVEVQSGAKSGLLQGSFGANRGPLYKKGIME